MHSNYVFFGLNIGRVRAPNPGYTKLIFSGKSIENTVKKKGAKNVPNASVEKGRFCYKHKHTHSKAPLSYLFSYLRGTWV